MESIEVFNWMRILFNEQTPLFLFEVAFRTIIIMIMGLFFVRLLGKKAVSQFSAFEFLMIIMWGTVIGDPTFYEDVAVLWSLVVLTTGTVFYRVLQYFTKKSVKLENAVEGKAALVIKDTILLKDAIEKQVITPEDIKTLLRKQGVRSFGEIEKAYLERSGDLSVFKYDQKKIGLPTDPVHSEFITKYKSGEKVPKSGKYVDSLYGKVIELEQNTTFPPHDEYWIYLP